MQYFNGRFGRVFVMGLDPGDDILESLNTLIQAEGIHTAVVITGVGTLENSVLHMVETCGYPPIEYFDHVTAKGQELVTIQGVIAEGQPHLHAMLSDSRVAWGGHVEPGCKTLYRAEITVVEITGLKLRRALNEKGVSVLKPVDAIQI